MVPAVNFSEKKLMEIPMNEFDNEIDVDQNDKDVYYKSDCTMQEYEIMKVRRRERMKVVISLARSYCELSTSKQLQTCALYDIKAQIHNKQRARNNSAHPSGCFRLRI